MKQNSCAKLPYLPFYVKDHQDDTGIKLLDFHDKGVWLDMVFTMHTCEPRGKLMVNGNALTDEQIFRMLGLDNQKGTTTLTTLLNYGVARRCPDTGAIMSKRMVEDEKLRKIRQEAGKKGGNPRLLKQNPTTLLNQVDNQQDNQFPEYESENENEDDTESEDAKIREAIYAAYPRKVARPNALKAIAKALKGIDAAKLLELTQGYAKSVEGSDPQFIPHPATWFNGHRFNDDPETWRKGEAVANKPAPVQTVLKAL